jgi:hypothetical protein
MVVMVRLSLKKDTEEFATLKVKTYLCNCLNLNIRLYEKIIISMEFILFDDNMW